MADLDVSDILTDIDFYDTFTVKRRAQTVQSNGQNQLTTNSFNAGGVVTGGGLDTAIEADAEHARNLITIHTQTRLFDATQAAILDEHKAPPVDQGLSLDADSYLPDVIVWGLNNYTVRRVHRWSSYGVGFYAVECELQDLTTSAGAP